MRKPRNEVFGEELCLVLKFLQHAIRDNLDYEQASRLLNTDIRVQTLIDWLMARYKDVDIEYKIATTFSLGILLSGYDFQFENPEYYMQVVMALDDVQVPPGTVQDLPSLIFMLPNFITEETMPYVAQVVEQLSATYFVIFRDRLDVLSCSTLLLGWARS